MSCDFENVPCAIPGNFICKKCKVCGHQLGVPANLPAEKLAQILAGVQSSCSRGQMAATPGAIQPSAPITGKTFADITAQITSPHAEYPVPPDPTQYAPDPFNPKPDNTGPGSQLKKFLSRIGITATPTCSCNARAQHMDKMGVEWCEQNEDLIVSWLKEEAGKRNLPFIDWPARMLVRKSISAAKKAYAIKLKKLGH